MFRLVKLPSGAGEAMVPMLGARHGAVLFC
jgi:hypothetical protein